jgi:hypothetical protein
MVLVKTPVVIITLAAIAALAFVVGARAQQTAPVARPSDAGLPPTRIVRHRIEITPRPLLYRRCIDWYELQYRPSGTVLYPQMRCWWVRG